MSSRDDEAADIELSVEVSAEQIEFEEREPSVTRFWGLPGYRSHWWSYRKGLPETIERGKEYRDIEAVSRWEVSADESGEETQVEHHTRAPPRDHR